MDLRIILATVFACGIPGLHAEEEPFGSTKLHQVLISVTAKDYAAMEPPPRANPFAPGRPAPGRPAPGSPDAGAGSFDFDFHYAPADVKIGDLTLKNIGLRYKGNGTYLVSARQTKRSFKIDFDRNDPKQKFLGHKKINLNSGVMDPTGAREALAYDVFRAAGVPAPRTAFAEVRLSVPGKFDAEPLGCYTLVEQVGGAFLKANFKDGSGMLLKPEGIRGLPYFGDDAKAYEATYKPKDAPAPAEWKRLVEFTRLINKADEAEFRKSVGDYLDLDNFARCLAANAALASMDGFLGMGHNYYLYLNPKTNKFVFVPWDLDLAFGAFAFYGGPEQMADLSIDHPHLGENKLIDRLLAMLEFKAAYRERIGRLAKGALSADRFGKDLRTVEQLIKEPIANGAKAAQARREPASNAGMFRALPLKEFVEKRAESILAQLAGKKTGFVPRQGGFGPPGGFAPNNPLAKPLFDALDADKNGNVSEKEFAEGMKKLFAEWDRDKGSSLSQKEIADGLQRLAAPRPFAPLGAPRP